MTKKTFRMTKILRMADKATLSDKKSERQITITAGASPCPTEYTCFFEASELFVILNGRKPANAAN